MSKKAGIADGEREDHMHFHSAVVLGLKVCEAWNDQIAVRTSDRVADMDLQRILGGNGFRVRRWLRFEVVSIPITFDGAVPMPPKPIA